MGGLKENDSYQIQNFMGRNRWQITISIIEIVHITTRVIHKIPSDDLSMRGTSMAADA